MPRTNPLTAQAATQSAANLTRPLFLIGVFGGPDGAAALVRTPSGAIERLEHDIEHGDMRLMSIGDGWAMVAQGGKIHRLTIG